MPNATDNPETYDSPDRKIDASGPAEDYQCLTERDEREQGRELKDGTKVCQTKEGGIAEREKKPTQKPTKLSDLRDASFLAWQS
jgi:hypothetical protein